MDRFICGGGAVGGLLITPRLSACMLEFTQSVTPYPVDGKVVSCAFRSGKGSKHQFKVPTISWSLHCPIQGFQYSHGQWWCNLEGCDWEVCFSISVTMVEHKGVHRVSALGADGGKTWNQSARLSVSFRCRMAGLSLRIRVRSSE